MKPGDTYTVERCVLMFLSAFDSTATEIEKKKSFDNVLLLWSLSLSLKIHENGVKVVK